MKVTCQSCQARYTIADDKVRGKVAKIRCKKCGTTILVDGTDGAPTIGQAPASGAAAVDALALSPSSEGAVEPLSAGESAPASPAVAEAAAVKPAIKAPEPVALRRPGRAASTDLFGGARGDDVMASAAAPAAQSAHSETATEKLTGARNENSVLFSLSALTGGSTTTQSATADAVPSSRGADLRSLIGTTSGSSSSKDKSKLDDIMNLGGGGLYSPALISPALAPPPLELSVSAQETSGASKGRGRLFAIIGAVVLVGAGAGAMTLLKSGNAPTASGSSTASASTAAITALPAATANSVAMAMTANSPPAAEAPTPAAAPTPEPTTAPAPTALAPGQPQPRTEPEKKPAWTPPAAAAPRAEKVAAAPVEKPVDRPAPAPAPAPARPTAAPAGGTGEFDRAAAMSVLSNTALAVRNCKKPDGPTGAGRVAITYANNGVATTATIEGPPFAGTAVGGCVAARFRGTSVPPFGGSPVTVHKSFTID